MGSVTFRARAMMRPAVVLVVAALATAAIVPRQAIGQASVGFTEQRPFVVGVIPVVGRGGVVGGVLIDAQGALARAGVEQTGRLRDERLKALGEISGELKADSPSRKISLRGLVAALEECRRQGHAPPGELQNLAGLTRIEHVLVYPEQRDILLAGPAEGWRVDEHGNVVGHATGRPVLQLDDLIVALRTAKDQLATGELITCSIDPTAKGLARLARTMQRRDSPVNEPALARFEQALGPQQITVTGVPPGSRFAHVLVAADFLMKRLGMGFEAAPIDGLPSYLEMLSANAAQAPRNAAPRWWMAPRYEPLARDETGLAWQLGPASVQTLTEEGFVGRRGEIVSKRAKDDSLAQKWADAMTACYPKLAAELPVFAELRTCMELAVVGALVTKEDLPGRAGLDLGLLYDDRRLAVALYHVPKTIDSRARLVRKGRESIVSVSGGVEIDAWEVLKQVKVRPDLAEVRGRAATTTPERWWWD